MEGSCTTKLCLYAGQSSRQSNLSVSTILPPTSQVIPFFSASRSAKANVLSGTDQQTNSLTTSIPTPKVQTKILIFLLHGFSLTWICSAISPSTGNCAPVTQLIGNNLFPRELEQRNPSITDQINFLTGIYRCPQPHRTQNTGFRPSFPLTNSGRKIMIIICVLHRKLR